MKKNNRQIIMVFIRKAKYVIQKKITISNKNTKLELILKNF